MCPASGLSAIATEKADSLTRPITITESVASNLLDNDHRRVSDRIPAYALYIDPPLGHGMSETEVRKSGKSALINHAHE